MKRCAILLVVAVVSMYASTAHATLVPADVMWVIDTSGSMSGDIVEIKARMQEFNTAMVNAGIDVHYGLTEFGGTSGNGYNHDTATLYQNPVDYATFVAGAPFTNLSAANPGATEKGSLATTVGLTATYRSGSVINIILVTDEDDDSSDAQFNTANAGLTAADALFNYIGVPGTGNTNARYGVLASNHGGSAFDIISFRSDPDSFFDNFIDTKIEEIKEKVIPEPITMAGVLLGIGGLAGYVRRRRS